MTRLRLIVLLLALTSAAFAQSSSNCPVVEIQPSGTVEGELSRTDCRSTGVMVWESPDTLIRQYSFKITQSGVLSVELYSPAFAPSFFVLGSQGGRIMYQADYTQSSFARSAVSLTPGTYTIVASSWGYAAGPFRLTTKFGPLGECTAIPDLKFGGVVSGDFAKSVCRVLDLQPFSTNTAGVERFRITVQDRGIVTVNLSSALNDSRYVSARLYDSANREVAGAREEFEGLKLTLTVSLAAGSYTLDLRAQPSFGTGAFTLTATFETSNQGQCSVRVLRFNEVIDGVLNATGCRYMDIMSGSPDRSVTDSYLVSPTTRGVMGFTLSSTSTWFVADLLLFDQQGRQLAAKQHWGGHSPAQIFAGVDPGNYYIYVRAYGQYVGQYRLGASFGAPRDCTPRALILGQAVSGELSATGCRVVDRTFPSVDDSPQVSYTVKVERSGLLALELIATFPLEAAVRLLSAAGAVVSAAQAKGGANSARIEAGVSPGVYAIEVRGLGTTQSYGPAGSYILKTSIQDVVPRSCPARDLALNDTVSASLSAGGCRQLDVFPAGSSPALLDPYRITLTEAGALTVEMVSADLDSFLSFYDKNLSLIGSDNNSGGGKNARLMTSLNPGTYFIHASAADAKTGAYNLTVSFRAASAPACPPADLALVGSAAGTLSASDCRVLELMRPSSNAAYVDRYRVTLPQRGVLSLDLASSSFTPWVAVYDSRSSQLGSAFGSTRNSARLSVSLNPGEYAVWASSAGAQTTGAYILRSLFRAMVGAGCPVVDVAPGATAQGTLGDMNCLMLDLVAPSADASFVSQYRITAPRRGVLTLEMESPSLDPALRLNDAESRAIVSNRTQRGSVARVVATVDPAPYIVYASSAGAGGFTFRSRLQDAPAPDCAARALGSNDTAAGMFDHGGCRGKDILPNSTDHSYAAQYKLVVAGRGTLGVEMNSSAFTPQVALYRLNFGSVAFGASGGVSGRSLLSATVNPGEYVLVARSSGLTTGAFTLKTSFQAAPALTCPVWEIGPEETVEATLAAGDCALRDVLPASASDAFVHRYQVGVTAAGALQIELSSADFVPVVSLRDAEGQTVAEATITGEEAGARLSAGVTPGTYVIFVTSARPAGGRYTLKTAFQPAEGEPAAATLRRR